MINCSRWWLMIDGARWWLMINGPRTFVIDVLRWWLVINWLWIWFGSITWTRMVCPVSPIRIVSISIIVTISISIVGCVVVNYMDLLRWWIVRIGLLALLMLWWRI